MAVFARVWLAFVWPLVSSRPAIIADQRASKNLEKAIYKLSEILRRICEHSRIHGESDEICRYHREDAKCLFHLSGSNNGIGTHGPFRIRDRGVAWADRVHPAKPSSSGLLRDFFIISCPDRAFTSSPCTVLQHPIVLGVFPGILLYFCIVTP